MTCCPNKTMHLGEEKSNMPRKVSHKQRNHVKNWHESCDLVHKPDNYMPTRITEKRSIIFNQSEGIETGCTVFWTNRMLPRHAKAAEPDSLDQFSHHHPNVIILGRLWRPVPSIWISPFHEFLFLLISLLKE